VCHFWQAYADDNTNYGLHVSDPDWLLEAVLEADNAGLQVGAAVQQIDCV
jgi:hypothetical protein